MTEGQYEEYKNKKEEDSRQNAIFYCQNQVSGISRT